jgi:hypothetical protein
MKAETLLLTVVLCSGLMFGQGLLGCGGDDDPAPSPENPAAECWSSSWEIHCYENERACFSNCSGFSDNDCMLDCVDNWAQCHGVGDDTFVLCLEIIGYCKEPCEEWVETELNGMDCWTCLGLNVSCAQNCDRFDLSGCFEDCLSQWRNVDYTEWADCRFDCGLQYETCWDSCL